jgi:SAM-dependent methyltransferase
VKFFKPPESERTAEFYGDLMSGKRRRPFWGAQRFDADKAATSASIERFFRREVSAIIRPGDRVLDLGCGAGMFLPVLSPLCARLTGLDVAPVFVEKSREVVRRLGLENTTIEEAPSESMPFPDESFDAAVLVDVLHHVSRLEETLFELRRVLKRGGRLIVYEPNKLNPVLWALCLLDRNEWGLLALGRKGIYRRLLGRHFSIERLEHNGLLIGPDGKLNVAIATALTGRWCRPWLGWLAPKILITARRPD